MPTKQVSAAEMERMMKVQEVILKAMTGSLQWCEAAEIIGVSDRTMRRWRARYEKHGYNGLYDYRKQRPSAKRILVETAEKVLQLYRERYFDFNVRKRLPAPASPRRWATAAAAQPPRELIGERMLDSAVAFVPKPFTPKTLLNRVHERIAQDRLERTIPRHHSAGM